jgi:hypothetical protein
MAEKIVIPIEVQGSKAVKDIDKVNDALDKTSTKSKKVNKALDDTEKSAEGSKKGFGSLAGLLKGGLGIGAVMSALDALGGALMENQKVQDLMNKSMIVFQGVVNGVLELLDPLLTGLNDLFTDPQKAMQDFGDFFKRNIEIRLQGALEIIPALGKAFKLLFEGQFAKAGEVAANSWGKLMFGVENLTEKVSNGLETITKNTKKAFDLAPQIDAARKQTARLEILYQGIVERYDGLAEKQRQLRDDERLTFEERIKANEQLKKELEEGQKKEEANINQRIKNKQLELRLNKNDKSIQNEILALKQELIGVDSKYKGLLSEQKTNVVSLSKEQRDAIQSVTDAQRQGLREIAEAKSSAEQDEVKRLVRERERIAQNYLDDKKRIADQLSTEKEGTVRYYQLLAEKAEIEKQYQVDRITNEIETNKAIDDKKQAQIEKDKDDLQKLSEARIDITKQALTAVADLFSENAEVGKAVAVSQAIIDTYTGATKALGQGGVLGYVGAGAIIATGFANIRKIMQTEIPGSDGSSYSDANASMSAPSGPNVGIISGQINSSAQLLGSLNNSLSTPPRAYVVGQDVNSQQSLDRHIRQNATL